MTPQEEKEFFKKLEMQYEWPKTEELDMQPTILRQEDFELLMDTLGQCIKPSRERDRIIEALKKSHNDLFQLFCDLRQIANMNPQEGGKDTEK